MTACSPPHLPPFSLRRFPLTPLGRRHPAEIRRTLSVAFGRSRNLNACWGVALWVKAEAVAARAHQDSFHIRRGRAKCWFMCVTVPGVPVLGPTSTVILSNGLLDTMHLSDLAD
jgi:hypothetical protein